jgi:hypothetical protein
VKARINCNDKLGPVWHVEGDTIAFPNATSGQSAREAFGLSRQPAVFPFVIADDEGYAVWTSSGTLIQRSIGVVEFSPIRMLLFPSALPGAATARPEATTRREWIGAGSGAKAAIPSFYGAVGGRIETIRRAVRRCRTMSERPAESPERAEIN